MDAANPKSKIENQKLHDFFRALIIVAAASAIGLSTNALKEKPVAILDPNGPGAIPEEPRISIETFKDMLAGKNLPLILDARSAGDYRSAHPPGAINVPEADFVTFYNDHSLSAIIQASQNVVVLCNDAQCPAADRVAKILRQMGHTNVRVLYDGWRAYE
jgi:rhodanese-related sulfurtransferase